MVFLEQATKGGVRPTQEVNVAFDETTGGKLSSPDREQKGRPREGEGRPPQMANPSLANPQKNTPTIIGVGMHAEVVLSILQAQDPSVAVEVVSHGTMEESAVPAALRPFYAGALHDKVSPGRTYVIGVGDNAKRKAIASEFPRLRYASAVHPAARIASDATIGAGSVICAGAVVETKSAIGEHVIVNTGATVNHHANVRDFCHVAPGSTLCGKVSLFEGTFIGAGTTIVPNVAVAPWHFAKAGSLVKASSAPIPMYEPLLDSYSTSVSDALSSGWISSHGKYIDLAEAALQETLGVRHAIVLSNGTVATHCLFLALKHRHPEVTKIYVPNNVYVAAWNCALMEYAQECLEVTRTDEDTWNMSTREEDLRALERGAAVLIVHNLGNVVNVPRLKRLRPDLVFVEDNCEGIFGKYEGVSSGCSEASLCASLSFFANKSITAGEGGAFLTNDTTLYQHIYKKTHQGVTSRRYIHDVLGYNYRMTNLQAALLYDQLRDLDRILGLKRRIFANYCRFLAPALEAETLRLQASEPETLKADWMFAVRVERHGHDFDHLFAYMRDRGVDVRPMFYPIESHEHLRGVRRLVDDRAVTDALSSDVVMLPSTPTLPERQQRYIAETLMRYVAEHERRPLGRSEAARVAAAAPAAIAMPAIDAANGKVGGAKALSAGLAEIEIVGAKGENQAKATPISSPRISAISA